VPRVFNLYTNAPGNENLASVFTCGLEILMPRTTPPGFNFKIQNSRLRLCSYSLKSTGPRASFPSPGRKDARSTSPRAFGTNTYGVPVP
jgi:hypothetical protein